jgi:DNA-binding NarL/FixJ family response regulator
MQRPVPQRTKILIVDDHEVVIEGIKSFLRNKVDFEIVGEALDGNQALELVERYKPEIVLMDISMPGLNGVEATIKIKQTFPDVRIIIYSMFSNKEYIIELFRVGISGYVLKQNSSSDLMMALNAVKGGGTYFSTMAPKVLSEHLNRMEEQKGGLTNLSTRERQIFEQLADGKSIKEISHSLCISPKTVESHKYNLMAKLGVQTITELTKIALKYNLIKLT